ncbi:MAG: hypothetical protein WD401_06390 [Thermomicrobiaceae bacterium]
MRRLELDETTEKRWIETFRILVIIAAIATLPLTAAYWLDWDHWGIVVADWVVWSVFVCEYVFYLAITSDRWQTTRTMWLSVGIILFSFPLLHEILQSTRLIRLIRPVPLLRQTAILRQLELAQLSTMRSKGTQTGWAKAKEKLGEDHWITHWMIYLERFKAWVIDRVCGVFRCGSRTQGD